jgi:predicted TPR repeat methyltransferase
MRLLQHSSGDLVADRRAAYAASLVAEGDLAAAADLMVQALELAPGWAAGWCLLGDYRSTANDHGGAIAAYRELQRLDRRGLFGAGLKLAALGEAPVASDPAYVAALFEDYASRFESELVETLGYDGPDRLMALLLPALAGRVIGTALDLGCGTGLMGLRLRPHVTRLEGIDLASGMVAEAGRKRVYDALAQAELSAHLSTHAGGLDLVTAADVLNYCGHLAPIFAAVSACLAPDGLFAFTVERHQGNEPMVLQPSLRFAHSEAAVLEACEVAGLDMLALRPEPLRRDRGVPQIALYGVVRKPSGT